VTPTRLLVIVESPYAETATRSFAENLTYLRDCLRDSWQRGELPFASHGFFPLFLDESDPEQRKAGIEAGYAFWEFENEVGTPPLYSRTERPTVIFYIDHGISPGMQRALERCGHLQRKFEFRTILTKELPK